ncbi:MAG: hypothetical protein PHW63_08310 [Alphaproteobacteria bacterium]|nr:hypothetical protein [Alphaproteobacteria bacterium]
MPDTFNGTVVDADYEILDEDSKPSRAIYFRNSIFKGMLQDVVTMPAAKRIVALDKMRAELPEESKAGFVLFTHKIDPRYKWFAAGHYTVGNALTVSSAFLPFGIEGKSIALVVPVVCAGIGRGFVRTDSQPANNFVGGYKNDGKAGYSALSMEYADWLLAKDETTVPSRRRALLAGCANGSMHNGISAIVRIGAIFALLGAILPCVGIKKLAQYGQNKLAVINNKNMDARFIFKDSPLYDRISKCLDSVGVKIDQWDHRTGDYSKEKIIGRLNPFTAETFSKVEDALTDRARERAAKRSPKPPALQGQGTFRLYRA